MATITSTVWFHSFFANAFFSHSALLCVLCMRSRDENFPNKKTNLNFFCSTKIDFDEMTQFLFNFNLILICHRNSFHSKQTIWFIKNGWFSDFFTREYFDEWKKNTIECEKMKENRRTKEPYYFPDKIFLSLNSHMKMLVLAHQYSHFRTDVPIVLSFSFNCTRQRPMCEATPIVSQRGWQCQQFQQWQHHTRYTQYL